MLLWSKGLGTKTLTLNIGEGTPIASPDGLLIKGTIKEPVWWNYLITMTEKDVVDVLQVAVTKETVGYLQTVEHPWKLFAKLVMAALRFLILWMSASIGFSGTAKSSHRTEQQSAPTSTSEDAPKALAAVSSRD